MSYIDMNQPWIYMYSPSRSPLPPPSLPNPSGSFPVHQARALVSCIQPGLVICFTLDNIHVSMLFSWNIPPSPFPTESKNLFYTSVSFCFAYRVIVTKSLSLSKYIPSIWFTAYCPIFLKLQNGSWIFCLKCLLVHYHPNKNCFAWNFMALNILLAYNVLLHLTNTYSLLKTHTHFRILSWLMSCPKQNQWLSLLKSHCTLFVYHFIILYIFVSSINV